ncbi:unnamed protein product [Cladocopium goreaui]|uniref:Uncharacterized protein n=1 Tax=Cladocopium goreaui TaxID=2562237 RepID=A0A9P1D708_9DINO|nr:unnamed protein product [Cladocopium goreaui]|mmetsp:Transcript_37289/g.80280  ORF Transcript_37289/g.80280 Transcript_37289/m.80280 type:complete len:217 (+) Transcript_37289:38-688(+)
MVDMRASTPERGSKTRIFEMRIKEQQITGQRFAPPPLRSPQPRLKRPELEGAVKRPEIAAEVRLIQPWFNLLQPCKDCFTSTFDEAWSLSTSREHVSGIRSPRTRSQSRTPGLESRSSADSSRPTSSQVPLLPRPRRLEDEDAATVWPPGTARWRRLQVQRTVQREERSERSEGSVAAVVPQPEPEKAGRLSPQPPTKPRKVKPRPKPRSRRWWEL